jgi:large subunit ribosomal protein L32
LDLIHILVDFIWTLLYKFELLKRQISIMAVPKQKVSRSRRGMRRSHDGIKKVVIAYDSVTGEPKLQHHISLKDGYYNSKQIIKPKIKGDKDATKADEGQATKVIEKKVNASKKKKENVEVTAKVK